MGEEIDLDNRIELEIIAIKGDTFGPLIFIFEVGDDVECDDTIETFEAEDLTGAYFEGYIVKGKNIVRQFTDDELSFDDTTSTLTFQMSSATTEQLGCCVIKFKIKQILNDITTTRISGTITFLDYV